MFSDRKKLYIISSATLVALLVALFTQGSTGRILAAIAMALAAVLSYLFLKKRPILSMNAKQILMLISIISVVYLTVYYLTGIGFGFVRNPYTTAARFIFSHLLPAAMIIAGSEIFRYVVRAAEDKRADVLCYISCVLAEVLIYSTVISALSSFSSFMGLVGTTLFPAVIANLLYHYLTRRYGFYPGIVYRAVTTLYIYIIPYTPAMADLLHTFIRLVLPIAIFAFIDSLYEKKRSYALIKKSKLDAPITVILAVMMLAIVMLISNQFRYGTYVIATDSMTGALDKGDAAIYEKYTDQTIEKGQVIAFREGKSVILHRVDSIEIINGTTRYYTKGDANEERDTGYITDGDIIGLVNYRIPYIGYPTIWLKSLFDR